MSRRQRLLAVVAVVLIGSAAWMMWPLGGGTRSAPCSGAVQEFVDGRRDVEGRSKYGVSRLPSGGRDRCFDAAVARGTRAGILIVAVVASAVAVDVIGRRRD